MEAAYLFHIVSEGRPKLPAGCAIRRIPTPYVAGPPTGRAVPRVQPLPVVHPRSLVGRARRFARFGVQFRSTLAVYPLDPPDPAHPARREWKVGGKLLAWERPLRKADLAALGERAPMGDILGVYQPLDTKEMRLRVESAFCFTTPHFDGHPALLVHLPAAPVEALRTLLDEAFEARAPKRLLKTYRAAHPAGPETA